MALRDLVPWNRRSRVPVWRSESDNPFVTLHREMNRLFDDFWRDFGGNGFGLAPSFEFPRVEMWETDRELRVEAELPGMDEKDVEVLLSDGVLTLRGEKKTDLEDKDRRLSERFYGRFERQIVLPVDVQEDKVNASFKKGVLTVTLPKSAESTARMKRIPIKGD